MIFTSFDQLVAISLAPGRGSSKRYGHIYFLDRSRCLLSIFSKISGGPGDAGPKLLELRLQTRLGGPVLHLFARNPQTSSGTRSKILQKLSFYCGTQLRMSEGCIFHGFGKFKPSIFEILNLSNAYVQRGCSDFCVRMNEGCIFHGFGKFKPLIFEILNSNNAYVQRGCSDFCVV